MDGGATLGTGTLSGGTATFSTSSLSGGIHSITVVYGGDLNYGGSTSSPYAQNVSKKSSTIGVTSSANPSIYGGTVTFTATVTPSTATGAVTFMDGGATLGTVTLSGGTVTSPPFALGGGAHSITAIYSGDTNFSTSTSSALTQTVSQAPTTTTISAPAVTYNANGIVTVTVTSGSLAVTGNVTLSVDGTPLPAQGLVNGSVSFTITKPSLGSHTLSASYAAQGNFGASSNTGNLTVNPAPTTTTINAPGIAFGVNGTVTVTVSSGVLSPTGNVTLTVDNGTPMMGSVTVGGTATFTIPSPSFGNHNLYASYAAQGNFGASSASGILSVGSAVTTTTITPPTAVTYGANASVTVTISSGAGTPTGNVSLSVSSTTGNTTLPPQGLVNGSTTFIINRPSVGNNALSASYAPQGSFGASSGTGNLIVNKAVLTVTANNASKFYNTTNPVFTASYSGFVNGDTQAALSGAPSLITTAITSSSAGNYPITAAAGSLSAANYSFSFVNGTLTVTPASTITSVASSTNPSYGTSVTFSAAVASSGGTPTGMVTFMDGATVLGTGILSGGTTYITSTLGLGSHSVTATFGGDTNFATSTTLSGVNQVIMPDGKLAGGTGAVDINDALKALRIAVGIDPLEASDLVHGDVSPLVNSIPNSDGKIDIDDVVVIMRKAANLPSW